MTAGAREVWEAYLSLHAYMLRVGSVSKRRVPPRIAPEPRGKDVAACERIAKVVATITKQRGAPGGTTTEISYWYLWAQLLRVSHRYGPTIVRTGEWRNLAWSPLHVLAGRNNRVSLKCWWAVAIRNCGGRYTSPETKGRLLREKFPRGRAPGEVNGEIAVRQHQALVRAIREHGHSEKQLLRCGEALVCMMGDKPVFAQHDWQPWLKMARPTTWSSDPPADVSDKIKLMLDRTDLWRIYLKVLPQLVSDLDITPWQALVPIIRHATRLAEAESGKTRDRWRTIRARLHKMLPSKLAAADECEPVNWPQHLLRRAVRRILRPIPPDTRRDAVQAALDLAKHCARRGEIWQHGHPGCAPTALTMADYATIAAEAMVNAWPSYDPARNAPGGYLWRVGQRAVLDALKTPTAAPCGLTGLPRHETVGPRSDDPTEMRVRQDRIAHNQPRNVLVVPVDDLQTDPLAAVEMRLDIERVLNCLPKRMRYICFALEDGHSVETIAKRLGVSAWTVRNDRDRARERLQAGDLVPNVATPRQRRRQAA
jgi:RNA polymerase sigma factor (sigma-70 family)